MVPPTSPFALIWSTQYEEYDLFTEELRVDTDLSAPSTSWADSISSTPPAGGRIIRHLPRRSQYGCQQLTTVETVAD
jgi:hypothetical protein